MTETIIFRKARRGDLDTIVEMLADDELGRSRETDTQPLPESYFDAFDVIDRDPNNEIVVAESSGTVVGVLQLTFIPYLTYRGSWRAVIEGVRIDRNFRSSGLGRRLVTWAIDRARKRGCNIVQLTSDKRRPDAIRFYKEMGFVATHEGFKLSFDLPLLGHGITRQNR